MKEKRILKIENAHIKIDTSVPYMRLKISNKNFLNGLRDDKRVEEYLGRELLNLIVFGKTECLNENLIEEILSWNPYNIEETISSYGIKLTEEEKQKIREFEKRQK